MVNIIWSFHNRIDILIDSLETAHKTCPLEAKFLIIDSNSDKEEIEKLRLYISSIKGREIRVCETFNRISLVEGWNLGLHLTNTNYNILCSSDVSFLKNGWYDLIKSGFLSGKEYILLGNHAVFGFNKTLIKKVGWFDEGFKNGPHFDTDYMIRLTEKGLMWFIIKNEGFYIHDKEEIPYTERVKKVLPDRLPMHDFTNEKYFNKKWKSSWPGWEPFKNTNQDLPHPPTHIRQVSRALSEINPHPFWL